MLINPQRRRIDRAAPFDASLLLDFDRSNYRVLGAAVSLSSIMATTRASAAYAIPDNGPFVSVPANVPRLSRRRREGGLVIEATQTNLALQSSSFATSPWSLSSMTASNAIETGPDGQLSAGLVLDTGTVGTTSGTLTQAISVGATAQWYTTSIYVKPLSGSGWWARYKLALTLSSASAFAVFDFNLGCVYSSGVTGSTAVLAGIEAAPLGYYRIWVSLNNATLGAGTLTAVLSRDLVAAAQIGFYGWGFQIEAGSSPSSPIATTTATATRQGDFDSIDLTTALSAKWFNTVQGTFVIDATLTGPLETNQVLLSADGGGGYMVLQKTSSNAITWQGYYTTQQALGTAANVAAPLPRRIRAACSYFGGGWWLAVGGGQYEYGSVPFAGAFYSYQNPIVNCSYGYSATVPGGLTRLTPGWYGGSQLNGTVHALAYIPFALSAADMTALVT